MTATPMSLPSDEQIDRIATMAAKKVVGEMFELFGVDISTPASRREFADDMGFLRTARIGSNRFRGAALTAIGGGAITGISYLMWKGAIAIGFVVR